MKKRCPTLLLRSHIHRAKIQPEEYDPRPMKTSKFTEEQIAFALRQAETGTRVPEVCRKMGIWSKRSIAGRRSTEGEYRSFVV